MRRESIKTPGLHTLHFVQRRLVDVCIEAVSHIEVLADRGTGADSAEKLAAFFDEMAEHCRRPHGLTKGKGNGKKS